MGADSAKLRQHQDKMPNYREILMLAEKLLDEKTRARTEMAFKCLPIDPVRVKTRGQSGVAYLSPEEIFFDPAPMQEYFFRLLKVFGEQNPERHGALTKAMEISGFEYDRLLKRLLRDQVTERTLEKELGETGSLLFFFLIQSLKPFLETCAESWRKEQTDLSWPRACCPFCGAMAGMGEIGEDGKRVLHCSLCATAWEFPRLQCPYCGNDDQDRLTYFQVEGEADHRVDVCLQCRNYIKTVDTRERSEKPDWEVEDFLTLHLDHLAQEEGYQRPEKLFGSTGNRA